MKLIAQVKLNPTEKQWMALSQTIYMANHACNYISGYAWSNKVFRQYDLHKALYYYIKESFELSAQVVVRCLSKVADAYKLDRKSPRVFKKTGGIAYDDRILSWNLENSIVSIWTVEGRLKIPFICGERQREYLKSQRGESDLITFKGDFYLLATCDLDDPEPKDVEGVLGIDLGIVNIATDSDGDFFSGSHVNNVRRKHRRLRTKLQKKQTKSAKRRLKKLSGKEHRFARDANHVISKRIVEKAQGTKRAIALEELKGIRDRVTVRKSQRATLHSWSFLQLKGFIIYKAKRVGVPVIGVDPRNTSRACPVCGCVDKANRPNQSTFLCVSCGFSGLADTIAAGNIARRAVVNLPNIPTLTS